MEPDILVYLQKAQGLIEQLSALGLAINPPVALFVFLSMAVLKRIDNRLWKASGRKRGARPGDQGYLVMAYPVFAVGFGAFWGFAFGLDILRVGMMTGAMTALGYHLVKGWLKHRKLLAKLRDDAEPHS